MKLAKAMLLQLRETSTTGEIMDITTSAGMITTTKEMGNLGTRTTHRDVATKFGTMTILLDERVTMNEQETTEV